MTIFVLLLIVLKSIDASRVLDTRTIMEKEGRDVILSCRFEQLNEDDRVMWSKDGVVLSVKDEISGDRRKYEILGKYDLIIKTVVDQDSGQYSCQNFEQMLSRKVLLTILTQPTKPDIQQMNKSLIENSLGKFVCITHGGNPLPMFSWFINEKKINESLYKIYPNKHRSTSELYFPLEKYLHNSSLICQVQNQALDKPLITSYRLNIQYKPEISLYLNQSIISNLNLLIIENEPLTIDCQIDANPPIIKPITWLKNSVSISENFSPSLTLQNTKRTDDGEYTCVASNSIGQGQSSAVYIRVQYTPTVRINGGGIINENEKLILVCDVDAYPSIDYYQWYKNNEKLNTSSLSSSIIIEKISKDDAGIYICMVKNTLKYSNGSSIEKFNKTQTNVIVQYPPKVYTSQSIITIDNLTTSVKFECEIDSNPDSIILWKFNNKILFKSNKYSIIQNKSFSYLILQQIQLNFDYGSYSCNASNKLGYNSTTIQLRSKVSSIIFMTVVVHLDVPESPIDLNITDISYSTISLTWKAGFDGGWNQSFSIFLNNLLWKETNDTYIILTNLQHFEYYNITIQAYNQLGYSLNKAFIRVQTKDIPIKKKDLPLIEQSLLYLSEKSLHYRLNNLSFIGIKIPLCIRIEMLNQTPICQHIVTSNGIIKFNENYLNFIQNISICLDQYEDFCGESIKIKFKHHTSFSWIFILISSIIIVIFLLSLCIFCLILNRRRRRNNSNRTRGDLIPTAGTITTTTTNQKASQQSILNSPTNFFSNVTYPEQQQVVSSYSKLTEILNTSSLSTNDQLDLNSTDQSSTENHLNTSKSQYISYAFPFKEDKIENDYSTSLKNCQLNKKTVYEVVV